MDLDILQKELYCYSPPQISPKGIYDFLPVQLYYQMGTNETFWSLARNSFQ